MSRDRMIRMISAVCAAVLICAVAMTATGLFQKAFAGYDHAEQYTAGDAEIRGMVKNLEVSWTSGKITVAYHGKDTVELRETANRALSEDQKMRWWLDGDTLRIQHCKSGLNWNWNLDKELTITLPEGMELGDAVFALTSGDVIIPELRTEKLVMAATSGNLTAEAEAKNVQVTTTSGNQNLKLKGTAERVQMTATSGNIRMEAEEAKHIQGVSTSGDMDIVAEHNENTQLSGTSCTARVRLQETQKLSVNTTSGNVTAELPETPGFKAELNSLSGSVNTGMAMTKNGQQYICGDGSGSVRINTTSGNIQIEAVH